MTDFRPFPKVPRWSRDIIITEKLDGTNASIYIGEAGEFLVGSRTRWITPGELTDNYGFAAWAHDNKNDLLNLGPGHHFGEWWGKGIQRGYGLNERRFSLFNVLRWSLGRPTCCGLVPTLYIGENSTHKVDQIVRELGQRGSVAANGYPDPEGVVIFHTASRQVFKKTCKDDETPKSLLK
jgi:hypothetical protein